MYRPVLYNEQEILAALAAEDQGAFETIYRNRWLQVFYYVRRLITDQQAAEDITTDTFYGGTGAQVDEEWDTGAVKRDYRWTG